MTFPITDLLSIATASTHLSPSTTIIPDIGFVVKTIDETGRKVFINICSSDAIPLPPLWPRNNNNNNTDQLPPEIISYLKPTKPPTLSSSLPLTTHLKELLSIPFQLAPHPRLEMDKSGQHQCTVTECVFNTIILHHAANYRSFKLFIIQLALGAIERQVGVQLNMTEFKLPKMRYKGIDPPPMDVVVVMRGKEKDVLLMEGREDEEEEEEEPHIVMQKKKTGSSSKDQRVPSNNSSSSKVLVEEMIAGATTTARSSSISTTSTFKKPKVEYINRPVEEVKLHIEIPDRYNNTDNTIVVVVAVCREKVKIGALENIKDDDDDDQSKKEEGRSTLDSKVEGVKVLSRNSNSGIACPIFLPGAVEMNLPFAVTTGGASCVIGVGKEVGGKKTGMVIVTLKVVPLEMLLDPLPV